MRALVVLLLLLTTVAGCLAGPEASTPAAELVLTGGNLWSVGQEPGFASALAIHDGVVVYVGDDPNAFIGPGTKVVDLRGATVLPGFRDHHMHPLRDRPLQPSYDPTPAAEQMQGNLENHAEQVGYHGQRHVLYQMGDYEGDTPEEYEYCQPSDPARLDDVRQRFEAFEREAAAQGLTTLVVAGMSDLTHMAALKAIEADGASQVRWLIRVKAGCYDHLDAMGVQPHEGDWVQWHGVKLYGDGYLGSWVAALEEPYSDRPGWTGIRVHTEAALDHFLDEANQRGLNVAIHAIGDATILQVLDAYERHMPSDGRWTVEHAQVTNPHVIQRFQETDVVASIQLSFATSDISIAESRLGDRLPQTYDWRGLREAGVVLAGGTDYPNEVLTPLWGLQREVTRQEVDGTPEGGWLKDNGLSLAQALEAVTWGSAYAAHEEERGRLAVGNVADLTVVREDLFTIDPSQIAGATVVMTVVNGKVVFEGETSYPPR